MIKPFQTGLCSQTLVFCIKEYYNTISLFLSKVNMLSFNWIKYTKEMKHGGINSAINNLISSFPTLAFPHQLTKGVN